MVSPRLTRLPRDVVLSLLTVGALVETVWTIYLALKLPRHYQANHWDTAWVGLDSAQVLMLLLSAWAAWRRRAILVLFSCAAGTLMLVDAWFDVTTARYSDIEQSVIALCIELPSAVLLYWIAHHVIKRVTVAYSADQSLARMPIRKISFAPRPSQPSPAPSSEPNQS